MYVWLQDFFLTKYSISLKWNNKWSSSLWKTKQWPILAPEQLTKKKKETYWADLRTKKIFKKSFLLILWKLHVFSENKFWSEIPSCSNIHCLIHHLNMGLSFLAVFTNCQYLQTKRGFCLWSCWTMTVSHSVSHSVKCILGHSVPEMYYRCDFILTSLQ